jgi:pantetheine-phosphate adenylyltransferase
MQRIAIFPGSFDPITKGHESIVRRAVPLFDRIVVAIGENGSKTPCFSIDQRIAWLKTVFENEAAVEVESFSGLTVEYCRRKNASCIYVVCDPRLILNLNRESAR